MHNMPFWRGGYFWGVSWIGMIIYAKIFVYYTLLAQGLGTGQPTEKVSHFSEEFVL